MPNPVPLDLWADVEGEIAVGANGDIRICRGAEVISQEVTWRLKTVVGDWMLVPQCGASLEELIGMPNTASTAALMEAKIRDALTHDGFLTAELRGVTVVPLNKQQLLGIIDIEYDDENFTVSFSVDPKQGVIQ